MAGITLDGILDEPEWRQARSFDAFVTTEPLTVEPAKYHTEALLYTDAEGIYVGFRNYQPAGVKRVQRRFARDTDIAADRVFVGIDFDGNGKSGYDFTVGAANTILDGVFNNEKNYSKDWDGIWYSQTSQDDEYWYVEILIPWTVAPMTRSDDTEKKMNFFFGRIVFDESLRFAYPDATFARPTFLSDWKPISVRQVSTSTLDWFPYVTAGQDIEDDKSELKAGLDVVWRPNSGTQFTGTINPDFGQVESDDLVVNFSAFETFFAEKRPFFTENQALFSSQAPLGDRLLHTRRIGAAPDVGDDMVTDIDLGAKLSSYGDLLDYGLFVVLEDDTGESDGRSYLSTRVQSRVGGLAFGHSLTYAERPTLDRDAMVNALDMDWQNSSGVRLRGQAFYSDVHQDANSFNGQQHLDAQDFGGWTEWNYSPSDEWRYKFFGYYYGDEFDMNDMGFLKRNDWLRLATEVRHDVNAYPQDSAQRSGWYQATLAYEENNAGDRLQSGIDLQRYWVFRSTREFSIAAHLENSSYDDLITRGNGLLKMDAQQSFRVKYLNPRGKRFTFELLYVPETKGTDKFSHEFRFSPQYYITDKVTVSGSVAYTWFEEWLLWDFRSEQLVTYESDLYDFDLKLDWYPDSRQEVRVKFQWVGVKSDALLGYGLDGDGRLDPSDVPVEDFSLSDTALQIRYRYELAPLSDIYLVYTRGGFWESEDTGASPGKMWQNAWDNITAERVLAKIRYRF
ncbi:MAG: DUF5916 domain-containing protein [Gammaproteobacteria bacterium]|nr:DUF5916 domain-containing protein [Gammaproteobacteria bacterium]